MSRIPVICAVAAIVAAGGLTSCAGYRLGSDRPAAMEGVQTIAVPLFRNDSSIPRSSAIITNRVVAQLQNDGTYRIVDTGKADAILRGTIRPLSRRQLRGDKRNTLRTIEQEIKLVLDYSVETRSGAVISTGSVEGVTSVYLDANFQRSEYQGLDDAAAKMAQDLVSRLAEGWGSADLPSVPSSPAPAAYQGAESRIPFFRR